MELLGSADGALGASDGVRIGDGLTFGGIADDFLAAALEGDDRWGGHGSFWVWDDFDLAISLHVADD